MTERMELAVQGMTCEGCVNSLKRALSRIPGVRAVEVDLERARAVVTGNFEAPAIIEAIRTAGYTPGESQ